MGQFVERDADQSIVGDVRPETDETVGVWLISRNESERLPFRRRDEDLRVVLH
jgi:hypothetical protein